MFYFFDVDKNNIVSITEFINGYVNLLEGMGVKVKKEFKESISNIAQIVEISNKEQISLQKIGDLIQIVSEKMNSNSNGLIKLAYLQNITNGYFNLERVVVSQQSGFIINTKLFLFYLLAKIDRANDGYLDQSDLVFTLIDHLKFLNVTLPTKVHEYLKSYLDIYESSVQTLMSKYGLTDISSSKQYLFLMLNSNRI